MMTFQLTTWGAVPFAAHRFRLGLGDEVVASDGADTCVPRGFREGHRGDGAQP